jgi:hypothetical protein
VVILFIHFYQLYDTYANGAVSSMAGHDSAVQPAQLRIEPAALCTPPKGRQKKNPPCGWG